MPSSCRPAGDDLPTAARQFEPFDARPDQFAHMWELCRREARSMAGSRTNAAQNDTQNHAKSWHGNPSRSTEMRAIGRRSRSVASRPLPRAPVPNMAQSAEQRRRRNGAVMCGLKGGMTELEGQYCSDIVASRVQSSALAAGRMRISRRWTDVVLRLFAISRYRSRRSRMLA